jgi:outer membrane protein assembly factor BamB
LVSAETRRWQTSLNLLFFLLMRLLLCSILALTSSLHAADWPNWRGPNQDGSSDEKNLPVKFNKQLNIQWAADLPGLSASVPVVWGDKVFLTAPIEASKQLVALCYDANTGAELWRKVVSEGGDLQWDVKSNLASPSATTDGKHVVFLFANAMAAGFDFSGKELWKRDFVQTHGAFGTQWTYASSPLLDGGKVYIEVLQRNEAFEYKGMQKGTPGKDMSSYILAIDPATGKDLWKVIRPSDAVAESLEAYSSPVIHEVDGKKQMLILGGDCITGHDAETGKELWRWGTWNTEKIGHWRMVASPIAGAGVVLACAPKKNSVYAVKLGKSGILKDTDLAWTSDPKEVSSDVSTPAFYDGKFYVLDSDRKVLACVEPKSGKVVWSGELPSKCKFESSPTIADGKIYMTNFWGEVYVVKAGGDTFELLSVNEMGDGSKPNGDSKSCRSSIAAANGGLYIRTQDKLYFVKMAVAK